MPRIMTLEGVAVTDSRDRQLGRISAVLFHPSQARAIGVQVNPGALLGVIDRRPFYALLGDIEAHGETLRLTGGKPRAAAGEKALGYSWDETVIWRGMPVRSAEGVAVGAVADATFDRASGVVTLLRVSTGVVGDVALGRLEVPGEFVRGFDGETVVVLPGYNDIRATGGMAKAAASGVATVKVRGGQVAEGALKVGVAAAGALGRSLKSGIGRKAIDKVKSLMNEDE